MFIGIIKAYNYLKNFDRKEKRMKSMLSMMYVEQGWSLDASMDTWAVPRVNNSFCYNFAIDELIITSINTDKVTCSIVPNDKI